jgi:hypothetical protein
MEFTRMIGQAQGNSPILRLRLGPERGLLRMIREFAFMEQYAYYLIQGA